MLDTFLREPIHVPVFAFPSHQVYGPSERPKAFILFAGQQDWSKRRLGTNRGVNPFLVGQVPLTGNPERLQAPLMAARSVRVTPFFFRSDRRLFGFRSVLTRYLAHLRKSLHCTRCFELRTAALDRLRSPSCLACLAAVASAAIPRAAALLQLVKLRQRTARACYANRPLEAPMQLYVAFAKVGSIATDSSSNYGERRRYR